MQKHLFSFGHGYTAQALSRALPKADWAITGTTRKPEKQEQMRQNNVTPLLWDSPDIDAALAWAGNGLQAPKWRLEFSGCQTRADRAPRHQGAGK